jgi:hypothetical protein
MEMKEFICMMRVKKYNRFREEERDWKWEGKGGEVGGEGRWWGGFQPSLHKAPLHHKSVTNIINKREEKLRTLDHVQKHLMAPSQIVIKGMRLQSCWKSVAAV